MNFDLHDSGNIASFPIRDIGEPTSQCTFRDVLQYVIRLMNRAEQKDDRLPRFEAISNGNHNHTRSQSDQMNLMYTIFWHMFPFAANQRENISIWHCLQQRQQMAGTANISTTAANELLIGYLHRIEMRCNRVNQLIDLCMKRLLMIGDEGKSTTCNLESKITNNDHFPSSQAIVDWRDRLQADCGVLRYAAISLLDIVERFPLDAIHQTASSVFLLRAHVTATYLNTRTVIDDAELTQHTLTAFHAALQRYEDDDYNYDDK